MNLTSRGNFSQKQLTKEDTSLCVLDTKFQINTSHHVLIQYEKICINKTHGVSNKK